MTTSRIISGPGREIDPSVFIKNGTVLLESIRKDDENSCSYLFQDPAAIIQCTSSRMVLSCIEQVDGLNRKGLYAAGFMSYEAGAAWTPGVPEIVSQKFPLLWFGLYEMVERFDSPLYLPASDHADETLEHGLNVSGDEYEDSVRKILQLIRDGETYQVNYTVRKVFHWRHGIWQLYLRLRRSQPVPYGAFLNCGGFGLVSLSPELFLSKQGNVLFTRPMKGTAPRGTDRDSDERNRMWLQSDPKNRAENLMIVDLMRNDLGKISETGEVQVFEPFRVEPYSRLFQMTTGVMGQMRKNLPLDELLRATFPPGSVTGAPKINTMKIIKRLESSPRKAYTGAIGFIDPQGDLTMNVAIRTIISTASGHCEMGVGSGIVADSVPENEFRETILKAGFLNVADDDRLDLFETILLQSNGSLLWLEEHVDRMEGSAKQLGYPFSSSKALEAARYHLGSHARGPAIVRLVLNMVGDLTVETLPLTTLSRGKKRISLSRYMTDPDYEFLRHKTTKRKRYDRELAEARNQGFLETLFSNIQGYLTEGAFTNVFIYRSPDDGPCDGKSSGWCTPGLQCGLLPGIWRRKFLESVKAVETCVKVGELSRAERIIIGNSVRGAIEVDEIVDAEGIVLFRKPDSPEKG